MKAMVVAAALAVAAAVGLNLSDLKTSNQKQKSFPWTL